MSSEKSAHMANPPRVLAVIPAFNEQDTIKSTVDELHRVAPFVEELIVNDGSADKTAEILKQSDWNYLNLPCNLGLDGAFQAGMKYALEHDFDYVVQFDADGQHDPAYIKPMVDAALAQNADIVIGSRFVEKRRPHTPRMVGSALITRIIKLTSGIRIADPTSGMRLYHKRLIRAFAQDRDLVPEPESLAFLSRLGAKISEVHVEMRERQGGTSYLTPLKSARYMARVALAILFVQWARKKELP